LSHSNSPVLCWVFSRWVLRTRCLGWLWTVILLISASWVARITRKSHWCPACFDYFWDRISHLCQGWPRQRPYLHGGRWGKRWHHYAQLPLVEMAVSQTFWLGWLWTDSPNLHLSSR
jgi:hypothetical protein